MGKLSDAAGRFLRRNSLPPTGVSSTVDNAVRAATEAERRQMSAAELADQMFREEFGEDIGNAAAPPSRYSLIMLAALQSKTVYQGTVPAHVKARRRDKNRVARKTRRLSRQRAR